jgi:hypothetical protein
MTDDAIPQEEFAQAMQQEQMLIDQSPQMLIAKNQHLTDRVIILRAQVNRLEQENNELKAAAEKRKPKTRT